MGTVYVWEDDFPTEQEYQNAYNRALSVMKLLGGEKQYEDKIYFLDSLTDEMSSHTYRMTYEISKLSVLNPVGNIGYLSTTTDITVNELYNVTTNEKITDNDYIPQSFFEEFRDKFYEKLHKYFRMNTDFEMIYNLVPQSRK